MLFSKYFQKIDRKFFLLVVGVMVVFGKEYEMPMQFVEIEKLELLDAIKHGDVKKWFDGDDDEYYDISVRPEKDEDGWCTNYWDIIGERKEDPVFWFSEPSGEMEYKTFTVKIRYNMEDHGKYARYMSEFWDHIMDGYGDDSDEEEEPDYLVEADKKPVTADCICGSDSDEEEAAEKIQDWLRGLPRCGGTCFVSNVVIGHDDDGEEQYDLLTQKVDFEWFVSDEKIIEMAEEIGDWKIHYGEGSGEELGYGLQWNDGEPYLYKQS